MTAASNASIGHRWHTRVVWVAACPLSYNQPEDRIAGAARDKTDALQIELNVPLYMYLRYVTLSSILVASSKAATPWTQELQ